MRGLIVYEGRDGSAEQVARALLAEVTAQGHTADLIDLGSGRRPTSLATVDFLFVGTSSTTESVPRSLRALIRRLDAASLGWMPICVFDTFGPRSFGMEKHAAAGPSSRGVGPRVRDLLECCLLNVDQVLI